MNRAGQAHGVLAEDRCKAQQISRFFSGPGQKPWQGSRAMG